VILRGFIRQIRLVPQDGQLEIELDDDLAAILPWPTEARAKHPRQGRK
jgi:hypothetical protein